MNKEEKKAQDESILQRARETMRRAIWSYINSLVSERTWTDADIDEMTDAFVTGGMLALDDWLRVSRKEQKVNKPLYGDKALEIFFGGNPSPVATAMWATAMRNNYEDKLAELRQRVPPDVRQAAGMLGGIVPGNVLTPEDYECLTTIREWLDTLPAAPAPQFAERNGETEPPQATE